MTLIFLLSLRFLLVKTLEIWLNGLLKNLSIKKLVFVIKTNVASNAVMDWEHLQKQMKQMLGEYKDRKCSVYLLHGDLTAGQMTGSLQ